MSEPLSLREARTKRQKADVYKTSRSEFRSTLNSSRNESPDSLDDKFTRRKIKKVDEKGIEKESKGEGSAGFNVLQKDKKIKPVPRDDDSDYDLEDGDTINTNDEDSEDNSSDYKNNDKGEKRDKKEDDKPDDDGGENNMNSKEGKGDDVSDNDPKNQYDTTNKEDANDKDKKNESDQNNKNDKHEDEREGGSNQSRNKNNDGDDKKNDEEEKSPGANAEEEARVVQEDYITDEEEAAIQREERLDSFHLNLINDMYEQEYEIDDDQADRDDPYEFLSQDGGSRGGSENSYGGEDEDNNDELEEVRSAG